MDKKVKSKEELAKELVENIVKVEESEKLENVIKDNQIKFRVGKTNFRVRKPNYAEQSEIEDFRRKKQLEYVKDDSYLFRKQWVEIYKKKGIDIDKMDSDIIRLQNEIEALMLRLAKTTNKTDIDKLKEIIISSKTKQQELNIEKTDLLSYSIEDSLLVSCNSFYAYLVLEKEVDEKWVKVFKSYEEFKNCKDTMLISKTFYHISFLIYDIKF